MVYAHVKLALAQAVLSLVALLGQLPAQTQPLPDAVRRSLPTDATVAQAHQIGPDGKQISLPVETSGRLTQSAEPDFAFVFCQGGRTIPPHRPPQRRCDSRRPSPRSYVQNWGITRNGIAIRRLTPHGATNILVASAVGASLGTYYSVFELRDGVLHAATDTPLGGSDISLDCPTPASPCKIVVYGRWTEHSNAFVQVYEWNGAGFSITNTGTREYELKRLEALVRDATAESAMMPVGRLIIGKLVVDEYLDRREFELAEKAATQILSILDDPAKSIARGPEIRLPAGQTTAQLLSDDISNAKAGMHEALCRVFEQSGRQAEAQQELRKAQSLKRVQ